MKKLHPFQFILWLTTFIFGILAYREFLQTNILAYVGNQNIWASRRFIAFLVFSVVSFFCCLAFLMPLINEKILLFFKSLKRLPKWIKLALVLVILLLPGLLKWMIPLPENFTVGFWMEFFLILLGAEFSTALSSHEENSEWQNLLLTGSLILAAGAAHTILLKFTSVTSYPFTLYWSEGNRFFDYSTLFGSFRYITVKGEDINAFISWGMQLPWALPFILPNISIAFFRFWYQLVWIIPSLLLGLVATRQARKNNVTLWFTIVFALWTYLFLDQGPIYAPLVIGAILTVIAIKQKLFIGIIIIFIASHYTRSARWTWSYAPGIWAGLLALHDIQQPSIKKADWPKLVKPVALGLAGYFGGQLLPSFIRSLNSNEALRLLPNPAASTSRQPLLWERLFPNPTFPPGILGGLAWATLPLIILLVVLVISKKWEVNWLHKIALLIVTGTFLIVGIIASVKIGGGSNLHNLDMFLVSLILISSSVFLHLANRNDFYKNLSPVISILLLITLISPVTYGMVSGSRLRLPSQEKISESIGAVQNKVEEYSQKGEVLFIDHRQLLTFNLVKNVALVDDYEKKFLMDQAMAGNSHYFTAFYEDLSNKRFALIVNEPANIIVRGSEYSFGEENDAYVHWVTKPILCTYEPIYTSSETGLEILIPRESPLPEEMRCQEALNP